MISHPKPASPWPDDYLFRIAPDHCADVLGGCYDVPFDDIKTALDIGANIGAFSMWAAQRWPGIALHCYEPQSDNYEMLLKTIANLIPNQTVPIVAHNVAVLHQSGKTNLYFDGLNCGEYSCGNRGTEPVQQVIVADAGYLPEADLIKIDTEGAEFIILQRMVELNRLATTKAIVLEYHSVSSVDAMIELLKNQGFGLHSLDKHAMHRGLLKFLRAPVAAR